MALTVPRPKHHRTFVDTPQNTCAYKTAQESHKTSLTKPAFCKEEWAKVPQTRTEKSHKLATKSIYKLWCLPKKVLLSAEICVQSLKDAIKQ